jgi:hypothetical protein
MLDLSTESRHAIASERSEHELRLPPAADDRDFAASTQPEIWAGSRKVRGIPATALLAQLVEHFHGKEGVVGSSPTEGLQKMPANGQFLVGCDDRTHVRADRNLWPDKRLGSLT